MGVWQRGKRRRRWAESTSVSHKLTRRVARRHRDIRQVALQELPCLEDADTFVAEKAVHGGDKSRQTARPAYAPTGAVAVGDRSSSSSALSSGSFLKAHKALIKVPLAGLDAGVSRTNSER